MSVCGGVCVGRLVSPDAAPRVQAGPGGASGPCRHGGVVVGPGCSVRDQPHR